MGGGASTRVSVPEKGWHRFLHQGGISFFNCRHLLMENIRPCGDGYEMEYEARANIISPSVNIRARTTGGRWTTPGAGRPVIFQ